MAVVSTFTGHSISDMIREQGGGTFAVEYSHKLGTVTIRPAHFRDGYMVAIRGAERILEADALSDFAIGTYVGEHLTDLLKPVNYFGAWVEADGSVCFDISKRVPTLAVATAFGIDQEQRAVWDIKNNRAIDISKGFAQ